MNLRRKPTSRRGRAKTC